MGIHQYNIGNAAGADESDNLTSAWDVDDLEEEDPDEADEDDDDDDDTEADDCCCWREFSCCMAAGFSSENSNKKNFERSSTHGPWRPKRL